MTTHEAKEVLKAYAGPASLDDPLMNEAFAVARENPELMAWLQDQQRLDAEVRAKLSRAEPPQDLAWEIIAGCRQRRVRASRSWLRHPALAAAIVLCLSLPALILFRSRPAQTDTFAALRNDMSAFLKVFPSLDIYTERQSEVARWLSQKPPFAGAQVPEALRKFPAIGCRELAWREHRIALVCLMVDGEAVHLFVLPPNVAGSAPQSPQFAKSGRFASAFWFRDGHNYLVMTRGSSAFLQKHLGSP